MDKLVSTNDEVVQKLPDLFVKTRIVRDVSVGNTPQELQGRKNQILEEWKGKSESDLESIPEIIAYRRLQEKLGSDPKQILPAVEGILVRGILKGRFPTVNSAADAANIISVENLIPIGLFDLDKIEGDVELKLAHQGDEFVPIGKSGPDKLKPNTPILKDSKKDFLSSWSQRLKRYNDNTLRKIYFYSVGEQMKLMKEKSLKLLMNVLL